MQPLGAVRNGVLHAPLEQRRGLFADDRADVGCRIHRIAAHQRLRLFHQQGHERVRDCVHRENALDGGAALAGVLGRTGNRKLRRFVEIGILHDDEGIVSAELEHGAPVAGP